MKQLQSLQNTFPHYLLVICLCSVIWLQTINISAQSNLAGPTLSPWKKGYLDIHHISTGRGNATFFIFPDGTTLLMDAGDISDTHPRTVSTRNAPRVPNDSKTAPEWIIDYIQQFAPVSPALQLDYAVITHFHDDHFGEWDPFRNTSGKGNYALTGIPAIGDSIPIRKMIDRGFDFPVDLFSADFRNNNMDDEYHLIQTLDTYRSFLGVHTSQYGMQYEEMIPGVQHQITLQYDSMSYPTFSVRNIAVNGQVWTGFSEGEYISLFKKGEYPGENDLSTCVKISYGAFDYFTGGDISGVNGYGESAAEKIESILAPVIGPVDVATLNHHGNRDSQNAYYVRTLRPRVWIGQSWSSDHPGHDVLRRITSTALYPGERDLFCTSMLESNIQVIGDAIHRMYKSLDGHIVVRVEPEGLSYQVIVLNAHSTTREITGVFGPYISR